MSYNQKSTGSSGSNSSGSGTTPNGSNNQTPQQVAKTLAGIQQQMQNLVHGQSALPQSTSSDLNAFFQQQRFQNMFKQQQQQLLQQHFQQQIQQQQKDRGGGGEPLALTRTPAAAELLNKTYQQHHQQQANGSSTASTLASVNQQIQQQLQVFPPNLMQQLQAFQYQMQQQHPQQPQQLSQQVLQQAHQQSQSGQHQSSQHQTAQQQIHGQNHPIPNQQQKVLSSAAAHMQQLQQSLQQKYLSVAAAASPTAAGCNKISTTTPPPTLSNQIKPANIPPNTQITSISPISSGPSAISASGITKSAAVSSAPSLLTSVSAGVKQVSPSISLIPSKPATSPTSSNSRQQNKVSTVANKAMTSPAPPSFQPNLPKPPTPVATPFNDEVDLTASINSKNFSSENLDLKSNQGDSFTLSKQLSAPKTENQVTKLAPSIPAASIVSVNHTITPGQNLSSLVEQVQQQIKENENKNDSAKTACPSVQGVEVVSTSNVIADVSLKLNPKERDRGGAQTIKPLNKVCNESSTTRDATGTETISSDRLSCQSDGTNEQRSAKDTKERELLKKDQMDSVAQIPTAKTEEPVIVAVKGNSPEKLLNKSSLEDREKSSLPDFIKTDSDNEKKENIIKENDIKNTHKHDAQIVAETPIADSDPVVTTPLKGQENSADIIITGNNKQNEVLAAKSEKSSEDIKIAPKVIVEPVSENQTKINTVPVDSKDHDGGTTTKAKVHEIMSTSLIETPTRKHGRQPRVSKALLSPTTAEKNESVPKRSSREERRISKQKAEELAEPPPLLSDTKKSNDRKSQRHRLKTILYQSPLPELAYITKLSASEASNSPKPMSVEDKLIVFYRNEYMAVRNAEGTFYLCQTMQNVYRTSPRISIRWLSEDKKDSSIFIPDFYDHTDIECVLTTVELKRVDKNQLRLPKTEKTRIENILKKAIDVEKGLVPRPNITEENPDGLDISLYKDESQIEKKSSTPSSSGRKYRRSGGNTDKPFSVSTKESKLKRGYSGVGTKPSVKKRRVTKKKRNLKRNGSDDEDATTEEEESDTEYRPNRKKSSSVTVSKLHRIQRSPLAKARAATPITATTASKTKTIVPQMSSPTLTSNNRIVKSNKGNIVMEVSTETPTKKLSLANTTKPTILKNKVEEILVETKTTKKLIDATDHVMLDNNPSTSADAVAAGNLSFGGTRSTRSRK